MSAERRRRQAVNRRRWVAELFDSWAETRAILADPQTVEAIAEAESEAAL